MHPHVHYPLFHIRIYSVDGVAAGWELGTNHLEAYLSDKSC